jgi:hypothetical protein
MYESDRCGKTAAGICAGDAWCQAFLHNRDNDKQRRFSLMKGLTFSIALAVVIWGCKGDNSIAPPSSYVIEGQYQYQGFNLDSNLCTFGVINLVLNDTTISGDRNIQGTDKINSQDIEIGIGNISGLMYSDSTFYIYLTSSSIPAVLLIGKFSSGVIKGLRILENGARPKPPTIGYYTLYKKI